MFVIHALYAESECLLALNLKYIETTVVKCALVLLEIPEWIIFFAKWIVGGSRPLEPENDVLSEKDDGNSLGAMLNIKYMVTKPTE